VDSRESGTLLDQLVPNWDVRSHRTLWIAAEPHHVFLTARHIDLGASWPVRALMAVRAAPAAVAMLFRRHQQTAQPRDRLQSIGGASFTLLAEIPGREFVLGLMGRFWTATGGLVAADAEQFRQPAPPGQAQAFWSFHVVPCHGGTQLYTETRVRCGDDVSRRHFTRYWTVVGLGSDIVRWSILRQIRGLAEHS
jgi:hypothetical protein